MAKQKGKADGETLFGAYYQNIYQDRWEPLKAALIKDKVPVAYDEGLTQPVSRVRGNWSPMTVLPPAEQD